MSLRNAGLAAVCAAVVMVGFVPMVKAAEKGDAPAVVAAAGDATGTWTWTSPGRNGGPERTTTLKLKQDGEKLTGTISMGTNDTEIKDGTIKGGELSFSVVRQFQGREVTIKYSGKLDGDVIKGKSEGTGRNGQTQTREFEAKRSKA